MKNVYYLILFFMFTSCTAQNDTVNKLSPAAFEKAITTDAIQILDVRTAGEYKSGHIKNALQADWNIKSQFTDRVQYVDKNKPVYIYCLAGGRSSAAATWMRSNGYKNVIELTGGINAWKAAGLELEGDSHAPQMTMEEYEASIPKEKTTLVDFGAAWCPPCITMKPVIDELENMKDAKFVILKVDAGVHTYVMKALNIEPIPQFIIYKAGKEVWRKQGIVSKEELLKELN